MTFKIRPAVAEDIPALSTLIAASVRGLQARDYSPEQMELALKTVFGVDTRLIADGTYFAVEVPSDGDVQPKIVGCGGWSRRKTLCGGDLWSARDDALLDPRMEAAKIRAFFVHPDWARRGIGSMLLAECESAAVAAGFTRLEMAATLTGVSLYRARGYEALDASEVEIGPGVGLPVVRMEKTMGAAQKPIVL